MGAKARLGIVLADQNYQPGALVLDLGEQAVDSTGLKTFNGGVSSPLRLSGQTQSSPYCSTVFAGNGDLKFTIRQSLDDWTSSTAQPLGGEWDQSTGDNRGWWAYIGTNGRINLIWSTDGTLAGVKSATSTTSPVVADGAPIYLRVTLDINNGAGGYDVIFESSPDNVTWTAVGATVTGIGVTSVFPSTALLYVGGVYSPASQVSMTGYLYSFILERNGVVVSNAMFDAFLPSFQDSQGNLWTCPTGTGILKLPRGKYLLAHRCSLAYTPKTYRYQSPKIPCMQPDLGASAYTQFLSVAEAYGSYSPFPTKATVASATPSVGPGFSFPALFTYSSV